MLFLRIAGSSERCLCVLLCSSIDRLSLFSLTPRPMDSGRFSGPRYPQFICWFPRSLEDFNQMLLTFYLRSHLSLKRSAVCDLSLAIVKAFAIRNICIRSMMLVSGGWSVAILNVVSSADIEVPVIAVSVRFPVARYCIRVVILVDSQRILLNAHDVVWSGCHWHRFFSKLVCP